MDFFSSYIVDFYSNFSGLLVDPLWTVWAFFLNMLLHTLANFFFNLSILLCSLALSCALAVALVFVSHHTQKMGGPKPP